MKYLLLCLLLLPLTSFSMEEDTCRPNASGLFHEAVWSYITKVLPKEIHDGKFNVFVVRFYHIDEDSQDISFTMTNIINLEEFWNVRADYYFDLGKEKVIVLMPDSSFKMRLRAFDFYPLNKQWYGNNDVEIKQRLYPSDRVSFISRHYVYGEMYTIRKCQLIKRYEGDADLIPKKFRVCYYDEEICNELE